VNRWIYDKARKARILGDSHRQAGHRYRGAVLRWTTSRVLRWVA